MGYLARLFKVSVLTGLGAVACVPRATTVPPSSAATLPTRLVLALDGLDFRDVDSLYRAGLFAGFRPPSRLVSTFPSISDVAWHAIFGVLPPAGYQRIYFSNRLNTMVGDPLDAIRPIEYERRMDLAFDTKWHHLSAYLFSDRVARREVDADVREFLKISDRSTVYAYNVGPDALQHTQGDITGYLAHLDAKLTTLQEQYRTRTGRALEVVILSDHGHNRASDATFLPLVKGLEAEGFRATRSLQTAADVAFSVDGVTTGFGVYCAKDSIARVANVLAAVDGVAVVTSYERPGEILVRADSSLAMVTWRGSGLETEYHYQPVRGDPLQYAMVVERMRHDRAISADGFASAAAWLRYTATALYPAAVPRIVAGHTTITRNPAPILVSLHDRVRVGLGAVSVANRLRPLGGTHGALSATNALGVLMTNFVDTHDDLAALVRLQLGGFPDLVDPVSESSQLTVSTPRWLREDRWSGFANARAAAALSSWSDSTPLLVMTLAPPIRQALTDSARFRISVEQTAGKEPSSPLEVAALWPQSAWMTTVDRRTFALAVSSLTPNGLAPRSSFTVRIAMEVAESDGDTGRWLEVASVVMFTDDAGMVVPW